MERSPSLVVVFDLGGVLVPPEGSVPALAAALDVPADALATAYWRVRDAYDRGGSLEEFWTSVTTEVGRPPATAGPPSGPAVAAVPSQREALQALDRLDTAAWSSISPQAAGLLAALSAAGTRTAVLSNAPASLADLVRRSAWSSTFDALLFSSDVGVMKPEAEIYRLAQERFGAAAPDLLFFDDRPGNVEGARRAGWRAEVWRGAGDARRVLAAAGALGGRGG